MTTETKDSEPLTSLLMVIAFHSHEGKLASSYGSLEEVKLGDIATKKVISGSKEELAGRRLDKKVLMINLTKIKINEE
jgi:hypothetical protein